MGSKFYSRSIVRGLLTVLVIIATNGSRLPQLHNVSIVVSPERRGTFMSINSSVMQMASGIASFIAGQIVIKSPTGALQNYPYVGLMSAIAGILCLSMLPVLLKSQKKAMG